LDSAHNLALAYSSHSLPLVQHEQPSSRNGQLNQLVLREIADIMILPTIKIGDSQVAVHILTLVGMFCLFHVSVH